MIINLSRNTGMEQEHNRKKYPSLGIHMRIEGAYVKKNNNRSTEAQQFPQL
jgi:hypothetical protein